MRFSSSSLPTLDPCRLGPEAPHCPHCPVSGSQIVVQPESVNVYKKLKIKPHKQYTHRYSAIHVQLFWLYTNKFDRIGLCLEACLLP